MLSEEEYIIKKRDKYNKKLNKYYGYEKLKEEQFNIIYNIIRKKQDTLAILATGFGKSICYQMPYIITKKSVIVVSPLIALMTDQTEELNKLNIPACLFNSNCKNKELIMNEILEGNNKIIYITPEFLENNYAFIQLLCDNNQLCLIAIDEAHCVSTWGLDFRPSYTKLNTIRDYIDDSIPILAVTATASKKVRKDIIKMLQLNDPDIIISNFDRTNLYISVQKKIKDDNEQIINLLNKYKNEYSIVYCKTRDETEKLSDDINKHNIKCFSYHAGLSAKDRDNIQKKFISGDIKCIIATIAFGMGINIKNVRLVIHYNCPKNMESYYQEIGRAGRDGLPSECYLFYSKKDFIINRFFVNSIDDIKHRTYQNEQINKIEKFVYSNFCRRISILQNFDSDYDKLTCNNCDICLNSNKNIKKDYSNLIFIILDLINKLTSSYSYGTNTYINILRGSKAKNITPYMKKLSYYNIGNMYSVEFYKDIFNELLCNDYLIETNLKSYSKFSNICTISCTQKAINWIKLIKNKYGQINSFTDTIITDINDKILLEESKLMQNFNNKSLSSVNDNIFTDDVINRLK